jgi:aspartyl/asparaginyl beta-hydroxylase (cupin superfamily)
MSKKIAFWDSYFEDVPVYNELIENYPVIKEEVLNFCEAPLSLFDYPRYQIDGRNLYEHYWKAAPLTKFEGEFMSSYASEQEMAFLKVIIENSRKKCPVTTGILRKYEEELDVLHNSFISRLVPGSVINPHTGWTDNYMRMHLGISCDPGCRITVGDQTRTWEDGKILAFKDGGPLKHSVVHGGTKERIILSVDVKIDYLKRYVAEMHY